MNKLREEYLRQAERLNDMDFSSLSGNVSWKSPSNIAFVKYWGKFGEQLPCNPSLSLTLKNAFTQSSVTYSSSQNLKVEFFLDEVRNSKFEDRIYTFLDKISEFFPFLKKLHLSIKSSNSFPHSTGIASSASGLSALALAICDIELQILEKVPDDEFYQKASFFSRLGSGSACRSLWGPWVSWGEYAEEEISSNESGLVIDFENDFHQLGDAVLIVSAGEKSVSSTKGHGLMNNHPFAESRFIQAKENQSKLYHAIAQKDFDQFIEIVENEALSLHAMMMTSNPGFMLFDPNSVEIINRIRRKREQSDLQMCFTLDAGPNIHLIYRLNQRNEVLKFIEEELTEFCEKHKWIDDQFGTGPEKIA